LQASVRAQLELRRSDGINSSAQATLLPLILNPHIGLLAKRL